MKKLTALILVLCMAFAVAACGEAKSDADTPDVKGEGVMTYAEYVAAALDTELTIETYVQAKQGWWTDDQGVSKATFYTQDKEGAYFLYNMPCSEEDAAKLVPGQKIRVTGVKAEWSGEIEIIDSSFEFLDAEPWIAEPVDATEFWGSPDLITYQNRLVSFKDVIIEAYDESGAAFAYKDPDGKTDDLYFKATLGDTTYDFCVEFYLCGKDTDVYKAVEGLQVGDRVDLEGFLYWYNGPNLHTTGIGVKVN